MKMLATRWSVPGLSAAGARIAGLALVLAVLAPLAQAQQKDVTPRRGIDPWDRAKVSQVQAKRWIAGATSQTPQDTTVIDSGPGGGKTCITNVGTTAQTPTTVGSFTPRYGPSPRGQQQERVVVVNGSVINVCK
ncbi:hypothetical protein [Novilysobacter erysipheiresistens]|uniref:Secreted protein n=1 Tax=Novilysobacter erysipheiresistens TaxID=1749332 RepID=A0ABU7YWR7_9GAMM